MSARKKLIVVLGMHRSGTSVVARGLKALGVALGENLLPAMAEVNERGFWEDQDFQALNVELMALSGLDWYDNCPMGRFLAGDSRLDPYKARAVNLLRERLDAYSCFAVKDPRMAVLLPFWRAVFEQVECDVAYLVAIRNPRSVVDSIVRRDGFGTVKIYYLWLEYVLATLLETTGHPRVVVDFDLFMADPTGQLERISRTLVLEANPESAHELDVFKNSFIAPELRHGRYEISDLNHDASIPPGLAELYASLLEIAADHRSIDNPEIASMLDRVLGDFRKLAFLFPYINELERRLRRLKSESGAQAEILALERANQEQGKQLHERDVRLSILSESINELTRQKLQVQERITQLESSTSWRLMAPLRRIANRIHFARGNGE